MTSGSEKRVRKPFTIRLSDEERDLIDKAAERAGLATGSYVRLTLLGAPAPRQVRRPPVEKKELVRLLALAANATGNLNQLAKSSNQGLMLYQSEILLALGGIRVMRDAILKALGREP